MTSDSTSEQLSLEERLVAQYGELMEAAELAELLRYRHALTLKRAIAAGRIPLRLTKVGRRYVAATRDVAKYLVASGLPHKPGL